MSPEKTQISPELEKLIDEDTRILLDAGFLDGGLNVTYMGEYALKVIAFEQNKTQLVAMAKDKLAKAKK